MLGGRKGKVTKKCPKRRMTAMDVSVKLRLRSGEVTKGKKFVIHFCVSSIMLSMREDIIGLRRELKVVTSEMKKVVEQNGLGQKHAGLGWVGRRLDQRTENSKQSEVRSYIQIGEERNREQISAGIVRLRRMKDLEAQGEQENSKCEEEVMVQYSEGT